MGILPEIKDRFTALSFDGSRVDESALERILEAGRLAPSAKNRQAWRFIAVTGDAKKGRLAEACYGDPRVSSAGCVVAACTTNVEYKMPNGHLSYPMDLAFAVSFMALQARHEDVDSAVLSTYDERAVREILTAPYGMRVGLLLLLGRAETKPTVIERLPKSRVLSREHW